ncbi:hypothetical protein BCV70DRAFT_188615 [Testicularia cyperi]|uniref:Uncharacterized protein n=1 Tax=Testicularia cyperi TaxID=1882483 RepID=A0A317XQ36_9BASI|nr:hypothetical protein BCV70DRAFT_188615 [Testicularia cyperi]
MQIVGESSRAGLENNRRAAAAAAAAGGAAANMDPMILQKRSPSPSPAPSPAVAAGPMPTQPPMRRSVDEPHHLRIRADDFERRLQAHQQDQQPVVQILGPFWARDAEDVVEIKRQLTRNRQPRRLSDRDALAHNLEVKDEPWARRQEQAYQQLRLGRRQSAAQEECFVGNEDLSCYPVDGTTISQNSWSRFIWNSNYPLFAQRGYVDVYLFQQDTDDMVSSWTSQDNGAGRLSFEPTDTWWAGRSAADNIQPNQNISWPFYFVVLAAGDPLSGTTSRLATFNAVQTTLPVSIASSRSAASAAAASSSSAAAASAASASASAAMATITGTAASASIASAIQSSLSEALESSLQASGLSGTETLQGTTTATLPNGSVVTATATAQANGGRLGGSGSGSSRNGNGLALPTYAIVLIAVLGFLAIVAAIVGAYFIMAALRRRRQRQGGDGSHRSSSPMMAAAAGSLAGGASTDAGHVGETSHMLGDSEEGGYAGGGGSGGAGAAGIGAGVAAGAGGGAAMMASASRSSKYSEEQPFTSDEASRMADAFRNALRNPSFAPALGESSGAEADSPNEDTNPETTSNIRASALLREELAAEGKDLRSVEERKRPTWHQED